MRVKPRCSNLVKVIENTKPAWGFLTNYARALLAIAEDPGRRLRDIGDQIGITERTAHHIVTELAAAGYITRQRIGQRNHYTINAHVPIPDPSARNSVGALLELLAGAQTDGQPDDRAATPA